MSRTVENILDGVFMAGISSYPPISQYIGPNHPLVLEPQEEAGVVLEPQEEREFVWVHLGEEEEEVQFPYDGNTTVNDLRCYLLEKFSPPSPSNELYVTVAYEGGGFKELENLDGNLKQALGLGEKYIEVQMFARLGLCCIWRY